MTDDDLDALLATPLADVADGGFSARVTARVRQVQNQRDWLMMLSPMLALVALVPFLPLDEFTHAILRVTPVIANSAAISLALGVLILTFTLDLRLRE
jgi:uncharacterized membrane protein (DUF485 family)